MLAHCRLQLMAVWALTRRYPYFAVAVPILVALSVAFCRRDDSEWEYVYVVAANHLRQGIDIYTDGNSYPPFAALIAVPATYLPPAAVRGTWLIITLACLAVMVLGAWRLAGGPRLQGACRVRFGEHFAAILGFLCGVTYLQNCIAHQQTDVLIGALLVVGCLALQRERSLGAATCFGLAAALKCTALLWFPYLLWRGRPFAAAWVVVVALGVNLLPGFISSAPSGRPWLEEYRTRFLSPLTAKDHVVGTWGSDIMYNQSLAGTGQRWFVADREDPLAPGVLRGIVLAAGAALVLTTLGVCGRAFRKLPQRSAETIDRQAIEFGMVLMLMLMLSPMSSKAHFGVLIVPGFLLARAAHASGSRLLWACVILSAALGIVSNKDPLGEDLYTLTLWYGTVTWHTLLLLAGSLIVVWRCGKSKEAPGGAAGIQYRRHAA